MPRHKKSSHLRVTELAKLLYRRNGLRQSVAAEERAPASNRHRSRYVGIATLLVGGAAWVDLWTGPELSFSVFYQAPIALAAWFGGLTSGLLLSLLSGVAWLAADLSSGSRYQHPLIPLWNMGVRLGFFATTTLLLCQVHNSLDRERERAGLDPLTGLLNRRRFRQLAELELSRVDRSRCPLTSAFLDVDRFKQVNDRLGHAAGDAVLQAVGSVLSRHLRRHDLVARFGGDEFAILLPESGAEEAEALLQRLKETLDDAVARGGWDVTFSFGAATFDSLPGDVETLLRAADEAMYEAKRQGRNGIHISRPGTAPDLDGA